MGHNQNVKNADSRQKLFLFVYLLCLAIVIIFLFHYVSHLAAITFVLSILLYPRPLQIYNIRIDKMYEFKILAQNTTFFKMIVYYADLIH